MILDLAARAVSRTVSRAGLLARAFADPELPGRRNALRAMYESMDPEVRDLPHQALGRNSAGCTATYNVVERCNFSCTACYLTNQANSVPDLTLEEVKAQLDEIRAHTGPWGATQITAGEVTLMPVEKLIEIVRYCFEIELAPMVMTHGETFRDDPEYLRRLVAEGGLDKVSIHMDTTQRGRKGLKKTDRERDIHWIRDEFAGLIRDTRQATGVPLAAASTFTVTEDNLDGVPDVVEWFVMNADAFRMPCFLPTAVVGRTRVDPLAGSDARRNLLWDKICEGAGQRLNPEVLSFGHPRCTQATLCWAVHMDGEYELVEIVREDNPFDRRFWHRFLSGPMQGYSPDGMGFDEAAARALGRFFRDPLFVAEVLAFCGYRSLTEARWLPKLLKAMALGRPWGIHPFVIVVHHFMSADELDTDEGQARLRNCAFRLPVDGRMVSMCEMNGTSLREDKNKQAIARAQAKRERKPLNVVQPEAASAS